MHRTCTYKENGICNDYKHSIDARDRTLFIVIYNNVKILSSAILVAVIWSNNSNNVSSMNVRWIRLLQNHHIKEEWITSLFWKDFILQEFSFKTWKKRPKYLGWNILVVKVDHRTRRCNLNKDAKLKSALIGYT